jgi:hypothetical protein
MLRPGRTGAEANRVAVLGERPFTCTEQVSQHHLRTPAHRASRTDGRRRWPDPEAYADLSVDGVLPHTPASLDVLGQGRVVVSRR